MSIDIRLRQYTANFPISGGETRSATRVPADKRVAALGEVTMIGMDEGWLAGYDRSDEIRRG